jgi:hypothetical protein
MRASLTLCQNPIRNWTNSACRVCRSQRTSTHKAQKNPPARPNGCTVCLVSKVAKPGVLRPHDARMLSWRIEVSPHCSGGPERGDYSKSGVERLGCGVGPGNGALAVSGNRCRLTRSRFEHASDFGSRLEARQYLSIARKFYPRRAALARSESCKQNLIPSVSRVGVWPAGRTASSSPEETTKNVLAASLTLREPAMHPPNAHSRTTPVPHYGAELR